MLMTPSAAFGDSSLGAGAKEVATCDGVAILSLYI